MSNLTIAILGFVGTSAPTGLAVACTIAMSRHSRRVLLFFLLSLFTFCWISDAAYAALVVHFAPDLVPLIAAAPARADAAALRLVADGIGAVLGGLVVWQLARALMPRDPSG